MDQFWAQINIAVDEEIPVITTKNRTRACRITHKSIYRELGIPNVRHRRIADPAVYLRRLLSLDYVIDHPELEWLPTETEKVWFCKHLDIRKDRLPRRLYTGAAGYLTRYFPLKLPIAAGRTVTFVYVDPGNDTITELRHWGQSHEHVWAGIRKHGMQVRVAAIALHSKAQNRARSVLNCWARDREGIKAGSYREAELQKELDTVSRGIDTFNSEVFARYGGQQKTARRYRELKDMLARPLPYSIRIDTFEIWRSERIYPDGVDLYETPA